MTIQIEMSSKQYSAIVKLVHLGNFMINSGRDEGKRLAEFDEAEQLVLSYAEKAGIGRRVLTDTPSKRRYLSETLEDEAHQHSKRYDEDMFWGMLVDFLALRDMREAYGEIELKKMTDAERMQSLDEFAERYETEFDSNGVDRLRVEGE